MMSKDKNTSISEDTTGVEMTSGLNSELEEYKEHLAHLKKIAPRFLREAYTDYRISLSEYTRLSEDYAAGRPIPVNLFDAVKRIYGISMVDIAVLMEVSFGVVFKAKTTRIPAKRSLQFCSTLCIPERFISGLTTDDFPELERCKEVFFDKPGITQAMMRFPSWKTDLANDACSTFRCPINIAKEIARVDKLIWEKGDSLDEYTESERVLIKYATRESKKYTPAHYLRYALNISGRSHLYMRMGLEEQEKRWEL